MKEIAISEFKAKCLAIVEEVHKTKHPIQITKFGKVVAELGPPKPKPAPKDWMGSMKGEVKILGDIISPASDPEDWEVLRD
jgi:antitoxin (DNA-binding transcriptional repressor) of toxin-antitoxin stability system